MRKSDVTDDAPSEASRLSGSGKRVSETIAAVTARMLIRLMPARNPRHLFPTYALVAALALAAPAVVLSQRPDLTAVVAADRELSARATSGVDALAAYAAPDLVLLYPGAQLLQGHDAARLVDSIGAATHDRLSWSPARAEISSDGTRGYSYGRGTRTRRIGERDSVSGIRYVAWWRRVPGTGWRAAAWLLIDERATPSSTGAWPCTTPAAMSADGPAATSRDVITADSEFAARSSVVGPAAAFADYVASDGISLGAAGAPRCGKHDVGAALAGASASDFAWAPVVGDASGDLGYTAGTATIHGEHGVYYSKYLTIWKRQPDGAWRFVADAGNAAPARLTTLAAH